MCETSNIEQYSAKDLSLLIECIDDKIRYHNTLIDARLSVIENAEDISERLEAELRFQISNKRTTLDDLYGLRVAVMNAHQIVLKKEKVINH